MTPPDLCRHTTELYKNTIVRAILFSSPLPIICNMPFTFFVFYSCPLSCCFRAIYCDPKVTTVPFSWGDSSSCLAATGCHWLPNLHFRLHLHLKPIPTVLLNKIHTNLCYQFCWGSLLVCIWKQLFQSSWNMSWIGLSDSHDGKKDLVLFWEWNTDFFIIRDFSICRLDHRCVSSLDDKESSCSLLACMNEIHTERELVLHPQMQCFLEESIHRARCESSCAGKSVGTKACVNRPPKIKVFRCIQSTEDLDYYFWPQLIEQLCSLNNLW